MRERLRIPGSDEALTQSGDSWDSHLGSETVFLCEGSDIDTEDDRAAYAI